MRRPDLNTVTWIAFLAPWAIVGLWDIYLGLTGRVTESILGRDFAWRWSIFPYSLAVVAGHLFYNWKHDREEGWPFMLISLVAVLMWDGATHRLGASHPWFKWPGIWFTLGIPAASFLWGQNFGK